MRCAGAAALRHYFTFLLLIIFRYAAQRCRVMLRRADAAFTQHAWRAYDAARCCYCYAARCCARARRRVIIMPLCVMLLARIDA